MNADEYFEAYKTPVEKMARVFIQRLPPYAVELDDLKQAGYIGPLEASRKVDEHSKGLTAYAVIKIKGAMRDELRALDPLSRQYRQVAKSIERARCTCEQKFKRKVTDVEIAEYMGVDVEEIAGVQVQSMASSNPVYYSPLESGLEGILGEPGAYSRELGPEEFLEGKQDVAAAEREIQKLTGNEKEVITAILDRGPTLKEIGSSLGFSESRACQLSKIAVVRIRRGMARAQA